jgi:hypothetical protein
MGGMNFLRWTSMETNDGRSIDVEIQKTNQTETQKYLYRLKLILQAITLCGKHILGLK